MNTYLQKLSTWLAQIPSMGYALIYLTCIPMFALVYCYMPGHFFHSTSKFEAYLNHHADELMSEMQRALVQYHIETSGKTASLPVRVYDTDYSTDFSETTFYRPEVENEYLYFRVLQALRTTNAETGVTNIAQWDFRVKAHVTCLHYGSIHISDRYVPETSPHEYLDIHEGEIQQAVAPSVAYPVARYPIASDPRADRSEPIISNPAPPDGKDEVARAEPLRINRSLPAADQYYAVAQVSPIGISGVFERAPNYKYALRIPRPLKRRLASFVEAVNGFPSKMDGNFGRMIYLSGTTITTLGFGDIVPLTDRARWLVLGESIIGVIVMGLFLNALAHEVQLVKK